MLARHGTRAEEFFVLNSTLETAFSFITARFKIVDIQITMFRIQFLSSYFFLWAQRFDWKLYHALNNTYFKKARPVFFLVRLGTRADPTLRAQIIR